ncbi:MAG TPA: DUF5134 domain-containing protein [Streptosporangiaceae bacterium]
MKGPSWLAGAFAAVMIGIALYCAGRLALSRLRRRETEFDADGLHVAMGVAMAGMLVPRLSPLPGSVWEVVFGSAAVWFGWQAIRTRNGSAPGGWRCPHPVPHLVECIAMLYMLLALPGSRPAGAGAGTPMPGMGGSPGAAGAFPALAVVLALFMVGYVVWTTDQLASMARARTAVTAAWHQHAGASLMLAPRLAACYKIAMGITMGYMLIPMF